MAADATAGGEHDVVVVGAGIIGLAAARELLARHPRLKLVVLDREQAVGEHQTSHTSGVIHAGIYYEPGSLKARLCVEGARRLYSLCEERGIPHERCGQVIVATEAAELGRLDELERRGRANGVPGLNRIGPAQLAELEPHCRGIAALHSPETGITDFAAVARVLAEDVESAGGQIVLGCAVEGTRRAGRRVIIEHSRGELRARGALLCAGLWSDRLAVGDGAPPDPRIVPFRGAYLRLSPEARPLVRGLIYPVPDPELPFLGVHLTRQISGEVLAGPSALLVGARDAYRLSRIRARDLAETLAWPGTWRLIRRYWRTGLSELRIGASRRAFARECARYVPELRARHLEPAGAGVRAQAVARDGALVHDFVVSATDGSLHVRNAPSPAATAALSIAELIADRAERELDLPWAP